MWTGNAVSAHEVSERADSNKGFLFRVTSATAIGEGLDGYDLGIISVVLPMIITEFGLSSVQAGLLGASTLAGIFFGGPIFGYLTDRYGRRKIFILTSSLSSPSARSRVSSPTTGSC